DLAAATTSAPTRLHVRATLGAGRSAGTSVESGESVRIMTGAPVPSGADAVVPLEDVEWDGAGSARLPVSVRPGAHVRRSGDAGAAGAVALRAGRTLSVFDLAVLGALGVSKPSVYTRPRVAVISTGDELVPLEASPGPGLIRDTNRPMLGALAE